MVITQLLLGQIVGTGQKVEGGGVGGGQEHLEMGLIKNT